MGIARVGSNPAADVYLFDFVRYSLARLGYLVLTQATRVQIPVSECQGSFFAHHFCYITNYSSLSSVGRALALCAGGRGFKHRREHLFVIQQTWPHGAIG